MTETAAFPALAERGVRTEQPKLLAMGFLLGSIAFLIISCLPQILNDGDTLWQIKTGEWIIDHRAVPFADPFAYTTAGLHWFTHEWLAEVLMAAAYHAAGMAGVMLLAAGIVGITSGLLFCYLARFMAVPYAITGLIVAMSNTLPSCLARPHLLVWPLLVIWCGELVKARANRSVPSFAVLPVMLVWANMHGSFMFGLLLPGFFLIETLLDRDPERLRTVSKWVGFILAAWLVALLNPEFYRGVAFPLHLIRMQSLASIPEWKPTDFSHPQPIELIIAAGLALGLSGRLTLPPVRIAICLCLLHAALAHVRNEQILGLAGALVVAEPVGRQLRSPMTGLSRRAGRCFSMAAMAICLFAVGLRLAIPVSAHHTGAAFAAVLDKVPAAIRTQPVLNDYDIGSILLFEGVPTFVDGRADLYGDDFLARYRQIESDPSALERALSDYRIGWAVARLGSKLEQRMDAEAGWHVIAEGDGVKIYTSRR